MNEDRHRRTAERLERSRRLANERLQSEQARLNARFDKMQEELNGKLNLKQKQIITASLELLKTQGLANLSLREIARQLHFQAPALYWYFKSKEDLVDYMAEAILEKEFDTLRARRDDETWQDWLTQQMVKLRKAMLAYPDGARVVAGAHLYPAVSLARLLETSLVSLLSAGIELQDARRIAMTMINYTFGFVIEEQAAPGPEELAKVDLERFLAPYPRMAESVKDIDRSHEAVDEDFMIGLGYIIKGALA
jgi:TetR/AcrR family tetracycline transcriptional repressor